MMNEGRVKEENADELLSAQAQSQFAVGPYDM
jgi:hypothetical protein